MLPTTADVRGENKLSSRACTRISCWIGLLATALLLWLMPPAVAAQEEGMPLSTYAARIDAALEALDDESRAAQQRLRAARAGLANAASVRLAAGDYVQLRPLLPEGENLGLDEARARLRTVREQLALAARDDSGARLAMLSVVLARPEFNPQPSLWDRIVSWVRKWLEPILPDPDGSGRANPWPDSSGEFAVRAIALAAGVAVVLLLSYWFQGLFGSFVADAHQLERQGDALPMTSSAARARALDEARSGDFRHAVRSLYLSALLRLEERGLVRPDRSLTNQELLDQVHKHDALAGRLRPVVATFDDVWYGVREPDRATFDEYEREIDDLTAVAKEAP